MIYLIRFLSLVLLASGGVLCLSTYRLIALNPNRFVQLSQAVIPILHVITGWGLFQGRNWSRHFTFFLALFYLMLGLLISQHVFSAVHFLPVISLVEFLPSEFFRIPPAVYLITCFWVLPLFALWFLSLRSVARAFDRDLDGRFSWNAPVAVIVAGHLVLVYALLIHSEIDFFIRQEPRTILGFSLEPLQGQIIRYLEFYLPLVLGLGFLTATSWTLFLAPFLAVYYWLPYLTDTPAAAYLRNVQVIIFGAGWIFILFTGIFYWPFLTNSRQWIEQRSQGKLSLLRLFAFRLISCALVLAAGGLMIQRQILVDRARAVARAKVQDRQSEAGVLRLPFKLEGTSIDAHGAYAIVDGRVIQAGAIVAGFKIEAVEASRILVSKESHRYWLDDHGRITNVS